jgi:cobalamin biosynthesis Mg chelatase CobN
MAQERTPPEGEQTEDASADQTREDSSRDESTTEPSAPSIGAHTKIEHVPPQERLAGHEFSTVDAMGQDKRREVTGQAYGPSNQRVIMRFVIFFAIVGAIFIGLLFIVGQLDQPPESNPPQAPWSGSDAQQEPPQPLQ